MKKWLIGIVSVILLLFFSSYFIIPRKIFVTKSITVNANPNGVHRFLSDESNWQKWWPDSSSIKESTELIFESGGYQFKKIKPLYNSFEITIAKGQGKEKSIINIFSLGNDSIKIEWTALINTGINPVSKIHHYYKAREISNTLETVLAAMQNYISDVKHIYGLDIRKEKVKVEFLISTKKSFSHSPTTGDIYGMINQIKKYIRQQQADEDDYPMLNITASDSTHFDAQVAIPVNKQLPDAGIFISKKMLRSGNILVAEITGGKSTADSAMKQVELYVSDYQYNNIAIPFFSLVTDRMNVTDTSKWVTRIYYPIM